MTSFSGISTMSPGTNSSVEINFLCYLIDSSMINFPS